MGSRGIVFRGMGAAGMARGAAIGAGPAVLLAVAFLALASPAAADQSFCTFGSGAGQCFEPEGVAVEEETGNVYVVDHGNNRVNAFGSAGGFLFTFGTPGSGPGQFAGPRSIAVDNNAASSSYRDVYVGTDNFRVQKFDREGHFLGAFGSQGSGNGQFGLTNDPIAVGPGGTVYVCDSISLGSEDKYSVRVEEFEPTGAFLKSVPLAPERRCKALAVDSSGSIYATFDRDARGVRKFDPSGTPLYTLDAGIEAGVLAVDASDDVFASQHPDDNSRVVTEYDGGGTILSRFGYGAIQFPLKGLAVRSATKDIYGGEEYVGAPTPGNRVVRLTPPPPGPLVSPLSVIVNPIGNTKATLNASINPEGKATTYHFEYSTTTDFSNCGLPANPNCKTTPESASIGADFELHSASAEIGCQNPANQPPPTDCLTPETLYHFRVVATNSDNPGGTAVEGKFTTKPPLEIVATWSTGVGTDAAQLHAEVNPLGIPATGHFQYVDDATYLADIEAAGPGHGFDHAKSTAEIDFGSGESPQAGSAFLYPLAPATTYHYRIVADDPLIEPVPGPERTLTTQAVPPALPPDTCPNAQFRTGASAYLPDCRAYEMVSPLDKENGDIVTVGNINGRPAELDQGAAAGGKLTYSSYRSFGDAQSAPFTSQYIATRYPTEEAPAKEGWLSHGISPPRGVNFLPVGPSLDTEFKAFSADLCTGWLMHDSDPPLAAGAVEAFANLYQRHNCGEEGYEAITTVKPPNRKPSTFAPELQGVSGDGSHAVYRADDVLSSNAPNLGDDNFLVYESAGVGKPRLICVLPGGAAVSSDCSTGTALDVNDGRTDAVSHAISADGSRVFWTASNKDPGPIYVRENPFGSGTECANAAAPCTVAVGSGQFWSAAADGSVAIFQTGGGDLYEFDVEGKTATLIAHKADGVVGVSEDASRIYLVSKEELDAGATDGEPNLYLYEAGEGGGAGSFSFIATLGAGDVPSKNNTPSPVSPEPFRHLARVSPSGDHLVFMSTGSLTGYDNVDAASGEADAEVYLYDATANGGEGELDCVSCNPTGARPTGRELLDGHQGTALWAAAQIPGSETQLYASRVLSEGGERFFFESYEGLVPRDTNGAQDVYEWERAASKEECREKHAELFVEAAGGCLSLISSGESAGDSRFVDAGADGSDVFIATDSSLLVQDPGLIDIYDARVGGGFPPPTPRKSSCEGEACQSPPAPPVDVTPASAAPYAAGNLTPRHKSHRKRRHHKHKRARHHQRRAAR